MNYIKLCYFSLKNYTKILKYNLDDELNHMLNFILDHKGYPEFIGAPYEFWVGSNVGIGTSVGQLRISEVSEKPSFDLLHSYQEGGK